jgi:hypothetical protein
LLDEGDGFEGAFLGELFEKMSGVPEVVGMIAIDFEIVSGIASGLMALEEGDHSVGIELGPAGEDDAPEGFAVAVFGVGVELGGEVAA